MGASFPTAKISSTPSFQKGKDGKRSEGTRGKRTRRRRRGSRFDMKLFAIKDGFKKAMEIWYRRWEIWKGKVKIYSK